MKNDYRTPSAATLPRKIGDLKMDGKTHRVSFRTVGDEIEEFRTTPPAAKSLLLRLAKALAEGKSTIE